MNVKFIFILFTVLLSCQSKGTIKSIVSCDFISGLTQRNDMECGVINVPENHDDPNGKIIQISYLIIKAENAGSNAFPMIYFTGGPGGASLTSWRITNWLQHPVRVKRDIILFDQRGIGYSSSLPNMEQQLFNIMSKNANVVEEQAMMDQLIADYKQKFIDLGIDAENYNSFQNARDVEVLMEQLGYEKYNLYGGSYGTRLARIVQDLRPELINSVIINSPSPLGGDFLIDRLESYSLALNRIFSYCKNDLNCNTTYPDLRNSYLKAIEQLKQNPLAISINNETFYVNAQDGLYLLRRKLYSADSRTTIPELITAINAGEGQIIKDIITSELLFSTNYNSSMWLSVERYEMYNPKITSQVIDDTYKTLSLFPVRLGIFTSFYIAGKNWHNASLPEDKKIFKQSAIPTLITVNYYDPVTPPRNGYIFQEKLDNAHLFILDEGGHGGGNEECRSKVMIAFMDDPNGTFDTSCLNIYNDKP